MGLEIERKFLVTDSSWKPCALDRNEICQGYISVAKHRVVRVRIVDGMQAFLTVKGKRVDTTRPEFEYPVPVEDAEFMLEHLCIPPLIKKRRYRIALEPGAWIVDDFMDDNRGLVVAEVEVPRADLELPSPSWLGREVTHDDRYANSSLHGYPYASWSDRDRQG